MTSVPDGPLVTVAIPTYRRPDMLRQAIESALAQTYRNIEVLVSDSAADSEIAELVARYGDPRLRYRDNGYISDAVTNAGAMYVAARGELIGTLHDDDIWEPDFLEVLVPPLVAHPEVVVSFADHHVIDPAGNLRPDLAYPNREGLSPGLHQPFLHLATALRAIPMTVAAVFRASAVDWSEWRPEAGTADDVWLAYLLARTGRAAWYEPRRVSRYRHHPGATSSTTRTDEGAIWVFDQVLADERLRPYRRALLRAAAPHHTGLALTKLRDGDADARQTAARHLRAAARGGLSRHIIACSVIWGLPLPVRRDLIDAGRRVHARCAARKSGYPAVLPEPLAARAATRQQEALPASAVHPSGGRTSRHVRVRRWA